MFSLLNQNILSLLSTNKEENIRQSYLTSALQAKTKKNMYIAFNRLVEALWLNIKSGNVKCIRLYGHEKRITILRST